jgi:hypothetical protein
MDGGRVDSLSSVGRLGNDWHFASIHDFNEDGKSDILWKNDDGSFVLWEMDGSHLISAEIVQGVNWAHDGFL